MKYKKLIICIVFILSGAIGVAYYAIQLAQAKNMFARQLQAELDKYLQNQQELLHNLGQQLAPYILNDDYAVISNILGVFENQVFSFAKQKMIVPMGIRFLSLNAPQYIINSSGLVDGLDPTIDEEYYSQSVCNPGSLIWSKIYTHPAMPKHYLINVGYGVVWNDKYLGHLDAQLAIAGLESLLLDNLAPWSAYFAFKLTVDLVPEIQMKQNAYWYYLVKPTLILISILGACAVVILIWSMLYKYYKELQNALHTAEHNILELTSMGQIYQSILSVQYKYGDLPKEGSNTKQKFDLSMLLNDVVAVNADLVLLRRIAFTRHPIQYSDIYVEANRVRIMQILSGIMYEILQELPQGSTLSLQLMLENVSANVRKISFIFADNGFYKELQHRPAVESQADVRAKGWAKIKNLLASEGLELQHQHIPYVGNTIIVTMDQTISCNVINLAFQ